MALRLVQSNDLVAYENLNVKSMVKNRHLAKSISDAGWSLFRRWLDYFGYKYGKLTIAVAPYNTSQNCSNCGEKVQKSLSTRTHICNHCGYTEDRDINAAINILQKGLSTAGTPNLISLGRQNRWPGWRNPARLSFVREPRIPRILCVGSVKESKHYFILEKFRYKFLPLITSTFPSKPQFRVKSNSI